MIALFRASRLHRCQSLAFGAERSASLLSSAVTDVQATPPRSTATPHLRLTSKFVVENGRQQQLTRSIADTRIQLFIDRCAS